MFPTEWYCLGSTGMAEKGCTETRSGYQHKQPFNVNFFVCVFLGLQQKHIVVILITKSFKPHTEHC